MTTEELKTQTSTLGGDTHPDPFTGEPGAHPVGTGVGAAAGGATGAALGSLAGPIGTAVGAVIGAVAGGLAGKGVAESIDPSAEDAYWREHHREQKYVGGEQPFDAYAPAYRTGYSGYREGKTFEEREADLRMEYEGGPQKAESDTAKFAPPTKPEKTTPGTMQNNMSTYPVKSANPANSNPGTMENDMSTYPLRWDDAREAARAAYERVRRGEAAKRTAD